MQSFSFIKKISLLLLLFVVVNSLCLLFLQQLLSHNIDAKVIMTANTLLFVVSLIGLVLQTKSLNSKNANAAIRGVMGATILKLFVLAVTAVLYIFIEKQNSNVGAIIISMVLYIIYTVIEIKTALKINRQQRAGN